MCGKYTYLRLSRETLEITRHNLINDDDKIDSRGSLYIVDQDVYYVTDRNNIYKSGELLVIDVKIQFDSKIYFNKHNKMLIVSNEDADIICAIYDLSAKKEIYRDKINSYGMSIISTVFLADNDEIIIQFLNFVLIKNYTKTKIINGILNIILTEL